MLSNNFTCTWCEKECYIAPYRIKTGAKFCSYTCRHNARQSACPHGHETSKYRKYHSNGHAYCSECKRIGDLKLKQQNPQRCAKYARTSYLRSTYGLEIIEFRTLLESQDNKCALCNTDSPGRMGWHIDHDHYTGKVRGALCHNCNIALGLFHDDQELLLRAYDYLEKGK